MRVPSARLRQVFEHTTHFKVTRPGGNPLVIAKKGLSPRTIKRLQSFAKGGEVGQYAEGVEVPDSSAQDAELSKIQAEADKILLLPPATGETEDVDTPTEAELAGPPFRRVVEASGETVATPTSEDLEAKMKRRQVAAPPVEPVPSEAERARLAASVAPPAPAAPPPVVVNVNAAPAQPEPVKNPAPKPGETAPVAAAPTEEAKPEAKKPKAEKTEAPAPVVPDLTLRQPAISDDVSSSPVQPMTSAAPVLDAGLLSQPLAEPKFPAPALLGAATSAAPVAAPAAEPVAAPASVVSPASAGVALGTPVNVPAVVAKMAKDRLTLPEAVAAVAGVDNPYALFNDREIKGFEALAKQYKDEPLPKALVEAAVQRANGAIAQARVDETAATAERDELRAQEVEKAERAKAHYDAEQAALVHAKELRANAEKNTDLKSFFESEGLAKSIFSIISLAIGGALSGYTGTPNYVLRAFNKAMERDIEEQKRRINSRWNLYKDATNSAEAATALVTADNLILTDIAMKRAKANQNLAGVASRLDETLGKLETELVKNLSDFSTAASQESYREAMAKNVGRPRVTVKVVKDDGKPTIGEQRLEFAKARYEAGKRFSVPDPADPTKLIYISASSEQTAKRIIPELQQRIDGIMRVEEFSNWLLENADKPVSPQSIKQMQTKIAGIVENYPGIAKGAKSLVTVAQAKLLKPAITSTTVPILQFMDVLGLTSTAMRDIRNDATRGVMTSIKTAAAKDDPGAKEFLSKWSPKGYRGRTGYAAESPVLAPAAGAAASEAAKVYTITSKKTGQSRQVTDAATADRFRGQPGFTVVP